MSKLLVVIGATPLVDLFSAVRPPQLCGEHVGVHPRPYERFATEVERTTFFASHYGECPTRCASGARRGRVGARHSPDGLAQPREKIG
jgi:hypothetical protein